MLIKLENTHKLPQFVASFLTHWGWVMHICVSKLSIIGSDNGLLPGWCQAIIWNNAGILLIWPLGTNFSEMLIKGLITVGRELRQQHPSDLLSGTGTSQERSSRDVPAGQQITRVLLP